LDNREFFESLEKRSVEFPATIIGLRTTSPNTPGSKVVRNQITKSGNSIGENYRGLNWARSKGDFQNMIKICESEASETQYWINVIAEAK
jgi:four helix bundle protein